ncbi:hypothetical protein B0T25DRAFT_546695 [Lasiosphaeria hispida]|uniref:Uncharacterized protein n=1 Tax=Lasiosphaeria hispida TaxID=260671 RepID=A0AAJ0HDM4_9PEZI|nr:hypothetical protein B0T25DRAFT_546695 [Lasiosphaeria hispida]
MRNKSSKLFDPLRAKETLRIEMPRRPQKTFRDLPSWYHRVLQFSYRADDRDVEPWDFDEDISDLEEDKTQAGDGDKQPKEGEEDEGEDKGENCECDREDPDCDCQCGSDDYESGEDDDIESEKSYNDSDADYYYMLKEMREERKREFLEEKLEYQKEEEQAREEERVMEKEVLAAHKSLEKGEKQGNKTPLDPLAGQLFKIFCSDYIDHCFVPPYRTKMVEFYRVGDDHQAIPGRPEPGGETDMIYGDMHLDSCTHCQFGPLCPPIHASQQAVKVETTDGKHELSFKFISDGYLSVEVSRELLSMARGDLPLLDLPLAAPEVFEFVGIKRDLEKEKAEMQQRHVGRRSPDSR